MPPDVLPPLIVSPCSVDEPLMFVIASGILNGLLDGYSMEDIVVCRVVLVRSTALRVCGMLDETATTFIAGDTSF